MSCDVGEVKEERLENEQSATASKRQDRLKRLLSDGSSGCLVVSKALKPSTLISVFLTGFRCLS